jgi:cytoskeletal protein RodZ
MRVQRVNMMKARLPRIRTLWLCLLAALFVALAARLEERKIFAQDSSQQTVTDYVTDVPPPAKPQPTAANTPSSAKAKTSSPGEKADAAASGPSGAVVAPAGAEAAPNSNAASVAVEASKPDAAPIFPIDPKNPVAVDSANLMKLANTLKSEVDKTTKDTLSVTVVREASEIEQLAHKMRTK